ncbi:MAG: SAM-dependent methyltransferase [Bacteroidota bacterium]
MSSKGKLFLIPSLLGDTGTEKAIPHYVINVLNGIDEFIVEDERTARRFLKKAGYTGPLDKLVLHRLNEHTRKEEIPSFLASLENGKDIGLLSDAGSPGIADPGADVVNLAHKRHIRVVPLVGASSLLLALMASGFNGQSFCFHGYLPRDRAERAQRLKELEKDAYRKDQTQLFIEAPYRNNQLLDDLLKSCDGKTRLCVACDLTLPTELIRSETVSEWRKNVPDLNDRPAVFLIYK